MGFLLLTQLYRYTTLFLQLPVLCLKRRQSICFYDAVHCGKMPNSTRWPSRLATILTFPHTYSAPDTGLCAPPHTSQAYTTLRALTWAGSPFVQNTLSLDIGMSNSLTSFQFLFRRHLFKETYSDHSLKLHHNLPHLQFLYFPFPFP